VHFTIYMYLYLYSYRRETARQLRMYVQLTRCFSAVAELLVYLSVVKYWTIFRLERLAIVIPSVRPSVWPSHADNYCD